MLQGTCIWCARLCTVLALRKGIVTDDNLMIDWNLFIDNDI